MCPTDPYEDAMNKVRANLKARCPEIMDLHAQFTKEYPHIARIAPTSWECVEALIDHMHKIAGIGATVGLEKAGEMAYNTERDLESLLGAPAPSKDVLHAIAEQIEAIVQEIQGVQLPA